SSTNLLRLKPARLVPPSTLSPMGAARPGWQSQQNCGPGPNGACRFCPLARSAFQKRSAKNMGKRRRQVLTYGWLTYPPTPAPAAVSSMSYIVEQVAAHCRLNSEPPPLPATGSLVLPL